MNSPILIVGGDSLLGRYVAETCARSGVSVLTTTRRERPAQSSAIHLDLARDDWALPQCRSAVLCAAVTGQETCRRDPAGSRRINVTQTVKLAERLAAAGAFVVFLSTNLVFDGLQPLRRPEDPERPMTEYGRQKAEAEAHLQKLKPRTAIVRLGKVIHPDLRLFQEWMAALRANQPVRAYSDYFCSPAPVELAARAIARIAELRAPGIWHVSAHDQLSYAEIARHFARRLGRDEALVQAGPAPAGLMEHLPMHTSLDSARTVDLLGSPAFDSRSALDEVLFAPRSVWAAPRGVGEGVL